MIPPLNEDIPKTSNNVVGWVLPIPIRFVSDLNTRFGAPSTSPAVLWYWTWYIVPPAPAVTAPAAVHSIPLAPLV